MHHTGSDGRRNGVKAQGVGVLSTHRVNSKKYSTTHIISLTNLEEHHISPPVSRPLANKVMLEQETVYVPVSVWLRNYRVTAPHT